MRTNSIVTRIEKDAIFVGDEVIPAHRIFWAAGVEASGLGRRLDARRNTRAINENPQLRDARRRGHYGRQLGGREHLPESGDSLGGNKFPTNFVSRIVSRLEQENAPPWRHLAQRQRGGAAGQAAAGNHHIEFSR